MADMPDSEVAAAAAATAHPEQAARLALLADPARLRLLFAIHAAPGSDVATLASAVQISPNAATKALHKLRDAGLITFTRQGRRHCWRLTDDEAHQLLHLAGAPHSTLHPPH